jgi:hypothetical protein
MFHLSAIAISGQVSEVAYLTALRQLLRSKSSVRRLFYRLTRFAIPRFLAIFELGTAGGAQCHMTEVRKVIDSLDFCRSSL